MAVEDGSHFGADLHPGHLPQPRQPPSGVQKEAPETNKIARYRPRRYPLRAGRLHSERGFATSPVTACKRTHDHARYISLLEKVMGFI